MLVRSKISGSLMGLNKKTELNVGFEFVLIATGFEPATSCSQGRRDNRATLHPEKVYTVLNLVRRGRAKNVDRTFFNARSSYGLVTFIHPKFNNLIWFNIS